MKTDQSTVVHSISPDFKANRGTGSLPSRPSPLAEERSSRNTSPRVVVIREEFIALTENPLIAVVLNQLLYWTRRVKDFDLLLEEEKNFRTDCDDTPRYGWIYKSADELIEETMLGVTRPTMRRYLSFLVDQGWVFERPNPQEGWDKTTQYRLNIRNLRADLNRVSYDLPGPAIFPHAEFEVSEPQTEKQQVCPLSKNESSMLQNLTSMENNLTSYTYTETIPEIKDREDTEAVCDNQKSLKSEEKKRLEPPTSNTPPGHNLSKENSTIFEVMSKLWENHLGVSTHLTQKRKEKLISILKKHFHNDVDEWDVFCQRVKSSPFLMGENSKGWRVNLDWILVEENLIKVLEGNFDTPTTLNRVLLMRTKQKQDQITKEILATIKDPIWKEWCTEFTQGNFLREPLSCHELEGIANARFLETENERLVWVGSNDPEVLDKIENLRLPLSSIVSRGFSKPRTIRTRLIDPQPTTERM